MIGLDSNVLLRFILKDDPVQFSLASTVIHSTVSAGLQIYVNRVVLCELVWVLAIHYGYARSDIGDTVERILKTESFEIENLDEAWAALSDYRFGNGDFADAFIARTNTAFDCETTFTFDKKAARSEFYRLLAP